MTFLFKIRCLALCVFFSITMQGLNAATYTTNAGGSSPLDWDVGSSWVGGSVPNVIDWNGDVININHDITKTGDLTIRETDFVTGVNVRFEIIGSLILTTGPCSFTSDVTSKWVISDDLSISGGVPFSTGAGTVVVKGDYFDGTGDSDLTVNGYLDVRGDAEFRGGGVTSGTGMITWATGRTIGGSSLSTCFGEGTTLPTNSGVDLSTCTRFLPVQFMNVSAECSSDGIIVSWSTATEKNNSHFVIEKTGDLEFYTELGAIEGSGTSAKRLDYSFTDGQVSDHSVNYYRIKQVDYNGDFDYSRVLVATCEDLNDDFIVYPTITEGEVTIQFGYFLDQFSYQLINDLGELIQENDFSEDKNLNKFLLDIKSVKSDIYFLKINTQLNNKTFKVIKD